MKTMKTVACYFRLDSKLKKRLDELSINTKKSKSSILVEALELYLAEHENEDFSFAIEALEELKSGDLKSASKKIDKVVKKLKR
ncbi:CopG family transcriptional regulator [Campylobacter sp. MIT 99-7217]|nr:CopG family transcriptional regulator [Campylobacter sp. MIT 99-7217]